MNLVVSNIAWTNDEEPEIAKTLQQLGIRHIEIALTKIWQDPTIISFDELTAYRNWWKGYGIEIVALQSMLFNRPDLKLFESDENRILTVNYLKNFIRVAGELGVKVMVFGSPKNRQLLNMTQDEAQKVAIDFFRGLSESALTANLIFCIEPNAPQYNCDFVTNASDGIALVKAVNSKGFGLHLDTACMELAGDDIEVSIKSAAAVLRHFHISAPMLESVNQTNTINHKKAAMALEDIGYEGFVSIEMKPYPAGENRQRVIDAIAYAKECYGIN